MVTLVLNILYQLLPYAREDTRHRIKIPTISVFYFQFLILSSHGNILCGT